MNFPPSVAAGNDDGTGALVVAAARVGAVSPAPVCTQTPASQLVALWNAESTYASSFMRD